jgi:hypothetical protein
MVPTALRIDELENTMETSQPFISAIATIGIPVTD